MPKSLFNKPRILMLAACGLIFYFMFGCATPMQMPVEDLSQIGRNEGIVVGSVLIKGGRDILGRKDYTLEVGGMEPHLKNFAIDVKRNGEEAVFVTKMLAGEYRFAQLIMTGFSTYDPDLLDVPFTVHPGKTVYIGRLVITFSGDVTDSVFLIRVDDAREETLASVEKTHGNLVRNAVTDLMGKDRI